VQDAQFAPQIPEVDRVDREGRCDCVVSAPRIPPTFEATMGDGPEPWLRELTSDNSPSMKGRKDITHHQISEYDVLRNRTQERDVQGAGFEHESRSRATVGLASPANTNVIEALAFS